MPNYQGNTNKSKEEEAAKEAKAAKPRAERIVADEVIIERKSIGRKIKEMIIKADFGSVRSYIWNGILIPAAKNMIVDTVEQGVKRTVYGDPRAGQYHRDSRIAQQSRTTYNQPVLSRPYPGRDPRDPRMMPELSAAPNVVSPTAPGYIISRREDAERVLEMMAHRLDKYEVVTVADLNDMLGISSEWTDTRWGWIDIRDAQIRQIREGWRLELPDAEELPPIQ